MLESGGVDVVGLRHIAFALASLNTKEAEEMLKNTSAGRKLNGYRNLQNAGQRAVLEGLVDS